MLCSWRCRPARLDTRLDFSSPQLGPLRNRVEKSESFADLLGHLSEGTGRGAMQSDSKQKKPVSPLHWAREQSLNKREFGTDGLAVPALNAWLQAQHWPNGADLFPDSPAFIQIELFLCRIEYARFADMTEAAAVALVPVSVLEKYAADIGSPLEEVQQMGMERWLAGASVHLIMRENIRAALEGGDLQRIDAWTLRPKAAPTGSTRTATPDTALVQAQALMTEGQSRAWSLKRVIRFPGYRKPLLDFLKIAHGADKPCPTARDVLDAWAEKKPLGVVRVMSDSIEYTDAIGNPQTADLKAIQQSIRGLLYVSPAG